MDKIVGIGEYAISSNANDRIRTFALGSCVAITVYCPVKKVMGMVHIALPKSEIQPDKGKLMPGYFADTAVPLIIDRVCSDYGCNKETLTVKLYGGANSIRQFDIFDIGKKNVKAVKEMLLKRNITWEFEDTGGTISRTLEAVVSTGEVRVEALPLII